MTLPEVVEYRLCRVDAWECQVADPVEAGQPHRLHTHTGNHSSPIQITIQYTLQCILYSTGTYCIIKSEDLR
jgi:hypothetical protein